MHASDWENMVLMSWATCPNTLSKSLVGQGSQASFPLANKALSCGCTQYACGALIDSYVQEIQQTNESWIWVGRPRLQHFLKLFLLWRQEPLSQTTVPPKTIQYKAGSRNGFIGASWKLLLVQTKSLLIPTAIVTTTTVLCNHSHFIVPNSL